jgi:hypothetical protein
MATRLVPPLLAEEGGGEAICEWLRRPHHLWRTLTLALSQREGAPLNTRCAPPSADAVAGHGRPLSYSLRSPSADAVAGGGDQKCTGTGKPVPAVSEEALCPGRRYWALPNTGTLSAASTSAASPSVGRASA